MQNREALGGLESALRETGALGAGVSIPVMSGDAPEDGRLGMAVEDDTVGWAHKLQKCIR